MGWAVGGKGEAAQQEVEEAKARAEVKIRVSSSWYELAGNRNVFALFFPPFLTTFLPAIIYLQPHTDSYIELLISDIAHVGGGTELCLLLLILL